ncbi:unnamed protein product [Commensalibacter communis]|nr:unnamed protein product [Commensalibacter communis]CAI3952780.1 unnamed protein product [Commensalibacter communis]
MYENGDGVPLDYKKAVEYYTKAANQGDATAQTNLGIMYSNGKGISQSYQKAEEYFLKAAKQGYGDAYFNLAVMYGQGKGVQRDFKKADEYMKQGCLHQNKQACEFYAARQKDMQSH